MSDWEWYSRIGSLEARRYVKGESLEGISVSAPDMKVILDGKGAGMVARNERDHLDMWFINEDYFKENYK